MGAVNYGSNDYVNLCFNFDEEMDEILMQDIVDDVEYDIDYNLDNEFYKIEVKPGYYDGLYLDIHAYELPELFVDMEEKIQAIKEVLHIYEFLKNLVEQGWQAYTPGWSTGFYENSLEQVGQGILKMLQEINNISIDSKIS